ncbi:MAG: NAD(P)/FAD-dependent oxidoreductase [Myxococcota bacterium]
MERYDLAVLGAGFGGLSAALTAAERGAKVVLLEQLRYPGGCASTFTRRGARFESGATLFSGFGPGQLFDRWIAQHRIPVAFDALDPLIELRAPGFALAVPPSRDVFVDRLSALDGVPGDAAARFFEEQKTVADALWALFDDPSLLPPLSARALVTHLRRVPRYLPLLRHLGRSLDPMRRRHGLQDCEPLRVYLDAVCQITVQASSADVEAPFALAATDYCFRGTGHVHGGIGELAWGLTRAFERLGGHLRMSDRVKGLARVSEGWQVDARKGPLLADRVVANLTPHALRRLLGVEQGTHARLDRMARDVESGWGAAMLYLVLEPNADLPPAAHHLELVADAGAPFAEGNHIFLSISAADEDRSDEGGRTVTVSTHVPMGHTDPAAYFAGVQARMRETLRLRAPEVAAAIRHEMTASPRTFERFTGRDFGYVGGIPRRRGLGQYRGLWPSPIAPSLWMVGDSVFPGQSTLATALGGKRTVESFLPKRAPKLLAAPATS